MMFPYEFFAGLIMFIFFVLIIALIVWAVIAFSRGGRINPSGLGGARQPLDIAKERYAKGEITKEEFESIKKTLQ